MTRAFIASAVRRRERIYRLGGKRYGEGFLREEIN